MEWKISVKDPLFIERFRAGDEQVFREVFTRYYKALCNYIYSIIQDVEVADDVVQDIFMALWNKHADFDAVEKVISFLFISARHAAINYLSHQEVRQRRLGEYDFEASFGDVEEELLIAEFDNKLQCWLEALPKECRRVISLALDGKKNAEIAEELSLSVQTVKNQKVKGLKILRDLYTREYALLLLFIRLFVS